MVNEKTYRNFEQLKTAAGFTSNYGVAHAAGVPDYAISRWKSKGWTPKFERLRKIADALHCSVDDFYRDTEETQTEQ